MRLLQASSRHHASEFSPLCTLSVAWSYEREWPPNQPPWSLSGVGMCRWEGRTYRTKLSSSCRRWCAGDCTPEARKRSRSLKARLRCSCLLSRYACGGSKRAWAKQDDNPSLRLPSIPGCNGPPRIIKHFLYCSNKCSSTTIAVGRLSAKRRRETALCRSRRVGFRDGCRSRGAHHVLVITTSRNWAATSSALGSLACLKCDSSSCLLFVGSPHEEHVLLKAATSDSSRRRLCTTAIGGYGLPFWLVWVWHLLRKYEELQLRRVGDGHVIELLVLLCVFAGWCGHGLEVVAYLYGIVCFCELLRY